MKILQFGRSMIEMLGILAIIGVLSIGGLLGYRRAVNNHQANTILDDASRLAFVVMENDRAYTPNTFITDNFDFVPTGSYNMEAFLGAAAGQFGIVVTDVSKGVCEALVPKAAIEYKVRIASAKLADNVPQLSAYGATYTDSTDICNSANDIALYFGDTSKQCTSGSDTECTSHTDCCHGEFCWFSNNSDCSESGVGQCKKVSDYNPASITVDGKTWTHSGNPMNWWSAQSWCDSLGLHPVRRADIDCKDNLVDSTYCKSDTFQAIRRPAWRNWPHWLEDCEDSCHAYYANFYTTGISYSYRANSPNVCAFCQ